MSAAAYIPLDAATRNVGALFALVTAAVMVAVIVLAVRWGRRGEPALALVACLTALYAASILHGNQSALHRSAAFTHAAIVGILGLMSWWGVRRYSGRTQLTPVIAWLLGGSAGFTLSLLLLAAGFGRGALGIGFADASHGTMFASTILALWLGWRLVNQGYWYMMCRMPMPVTTQDEEPVVTEPVIGD